MPVDNVFTDPTFEHGQVVNVLLLPIDDPYGVQDMELHYRNITNSVLQEFGKYNYFQIQRAPDIYTRVGPFIDLHTGQVDRVVLGTVGNEYNVDAVMMVSIEDFRAYPPMRMRLKAALIDTQTGVRIWAFDHTFDTDDADVINGMRVWWNAYVAGGDRRNRFHLATVRPTLFTNYVFHTVARSYGISRVENAKAIQRIKEMEAAAECHLQEMQTSSYDSEYEGPTEEWSEEMTGQFEE